MKSDIDTLEVITVDKPLKGEFTLQLVHYKDRPQKKQLGDVSFMYFTPVDTTNTNSTRKSRPPAFNLKVYRVATTQTGANVHQHSSGKFYFDQQGGIALSGKTQKKRTQETLKRGYYAPSTKDNTYLPPQPNFTELAQGGIPGYPIKTLKNTVLNWRINNDDPPAIITSVGFTGNPLGCTVVINPIKPNEYILPTGNVTGNVRVSFSYILNGSTHTGYNDHNIISYYNFHGHISYNHKASVSDAERETFIGRVILWGKNLEGEQFSIISEQSINSGANGYFCFNNISIPIVQVGFYTEYDTVPILYFYRNEDYQDIYYKYKNGVGFHHPESTSLCDDQLNFNADYRIMLSEGESPDNVFINDLDNGIIRFKDSMSCCALNIAYQMERLKDFFASQYGVQLNYQTMDFVVLVDRSWEDVGNAYYQNGGGIVSGRSAISYRGAENLPELVTAWSNATILHELTHLVHDKLSGINVGNTINWVWAGPELHEDLENKQKEAYIEGMAFYIPCLIQKETTRMFWDAPAAQFYKLVVYTGHQLSINQVIDIESGQVDNQYVYPRFDHYAGSTACILWDLSDNHNDTSIQYNFDVIDFTKSDVLSYITYNSSSGSPQILCQFLNRMWTSNLLSNQEIKNKFRLLCENRDIHTSDYNLYKLSVGNECLYNSISEAIAASCDGDVIVIQPGLYGESLCLEKSITLEGDTTNANDVVVEGLLTIDNDESIAIKNISFTNPVGNGIEVCNSFVNFENVNIETCDGSGLRCSNPEKLRIISSRIINNAGNGLESSETQNQPIVDWGIVKGSLIADNEIYGVKTWTPLSFNNCTISGNQYGINDLNHTLINTILYGNDYNVPAQSTEPIISYSCIGGGYPGTGNIDANPAFTNCAEGDYSLIWDECGPSPCIDSGFSGLSGDDTDPDGTAKDMGCFYYSHSVATYEYEVVPSEKKIFWQCFPVIDYVSCPNGEYWDELGYLFCNHITLPNPQLRNVDWYYDGLQGRMEYSGQWINKDHRVSSTQGYKLFFEDVPAIDQINVRGFRTDPLTTPTAMKVFCGGQRQENWIGYYLQDTQNAWQALSKQIPNDPDNRTYLDYIYQIKAQKWGAIRLKPTLGSPLILEQGDYTVSEGDMLVLELIEGAPEEFFWNPTIAVAPVERSEPQSFAYEEKLDYTQCYVQLDPTDLPTEIGLYIDDVCLGAAVVEDSLVQVNLYLDDVRGDGRLEVIFYYENKGRSLRNEYRVFNIDRMIFESKELLLSDIGDYAYISFAGNNGLVPLVTSLDQNYPNPFNPSTTIAFSLAKPGRASLVIYNLKGQVVQRLINSDLNAGSHKVVWNGKDTSNRSVASGMYFYRLESGDYTATRKMLLMK